MTDSHNDQSNCSCQCDCTNQPVDPMLKIREGLPMEAQLILRDADIMDIFHHELKGTLADLDEALEEAGCGTRTIRELRNVVIDCVLARNSEFDTVKEMDAYYREKSYYQDEFGAGISDYGWKPRPNYDLLGYGSHYEDITERPEYRVRPHSGSFARDFQRAARDYDRTMTALCPRWTVTV